MDAMTSSQREFLSIVDPDALIRDENQADEISVDDEIESIIADAESRGDKKLLKLAIAARDTPYQWVRARLWSYIDDHRTDEDIK